MIALVLFCIAIVFTLIHFEMRRKESDFVEVFLSYILFFNIGFTGLIAFVGHLFKPNEIAALIGWPPDNPFQYEVGMADLAFGVLGVLSLYFRGLFWLATVTGACIYLLGDFVIHINEYMLGDTAPYNIGILIWLSDLVIPLLLIILLFAYFRRRSLVSY
jgi:hypothetical protein